MQLTDFKGCFRKQCLRILFFSIFIFSLSFTTAQEIEETSKKAVWKISSANEAQGTAFFISNSHILTNYHVIEYLLEGQELKDILLSQEENKKTFKLKRIVALSIYQDLALLEVNGFHPYFIDLKESLNKKGTGFLNTAEERLHVLGYPGGDFTIIKQIISFDKETNSAQKNSIKNNSFSSSLEDSFLSDNYYTDGASGSPVFNQESLFRGVMKSRIANVKEFINLDSLRFFFRDESLLCENLNPKECLARSRRLYLDSIESGKYKNYFSIGFNYYAGVGVEKNLDLARYWFEKSAEREYLPAQTRLALMCLKGEGGEKDFSKAKKLLSKTAEKGYSIAQYQLAEMYRKGLGGKKNLDLARYWYEKSAQQEYLPAQTKLALMCLNGEGGEKDFSKAKKLLSKTAEKGYSIGQYYLAEMYHKGLGVEKNLDLARYWYELSAKQGYSPAQTQLALMYLKGEGGEKDFPKAKRLLEKAAQQGDAEAQFHLGMIYDKGLGVEKNLDLARFWLEKSAEQEYLDAQFKLAIMDREEEEKKQNLKLTEMRDQSKGEGIKNKKSLYERCLHIVKKYL